MKKEQKCDGCQFHFVWHNQSYVSFMTAVSNEKTSRVRVNPVHSTIHSPCVGRLRKQSKFQNAMNSFHSEGGDEKFEYTIYM